MAVRWQDANFSWRAAGAKWRSAEYWRFILPSNLLSVWMVWLPAVTVIYCLPPSLQIPLFSLVLCFWSVLLQLVTKADTAAAAPQTQQPLHSGAAGQTGAVQLADWEEEHESG